MKGQGFSSLPFDVQLEILRHLAPAALAQFSAVDRRWNAFIKSSSSSPLHRNFEPMEIPDDRLPGLARWLELSRSVVGRAGGWHTLRFPKKLMSTSSALSFVRPSRHLTRLDLFFDGDLYKSDLTTRGLLRVNTAQWNVACATLQRNTDEAVACILESCPNLLSLKISCEYDYSGNDSLLSCRMFRVPSHVTVGDNLRSLELFDLRPRIDEQFLRLVGKLETFIVHGRGILCDQYPIWTPLTLRVILRCFERGGNIETFISKQRMGPDGHAAYTLFAALEEGLLKKGEVDSRWENIDQARDAFDGELYSDLVCGSDGQHYGAPATVRLDKLKTFLINNSATALRFETGDGTDLRDAEVALIRAPSLEQFTISCAGPSAIIPVVRNAANLTALHIEYVDAKMELVDVLSVFKAAHTVEELKISVSFASWYYYAHSVAFRQKHILEKLAETGPDERWLLPRLRKVSGIQDEKETGTALLWLVESRLAASTASAGHAEGREAGDTCRPISSVECRFSGSIKDSEDERMYAADKERLKELLEEFVN